MLKKRTVKTPLQYVVTYFWLTLGSFLVAVALSNFLAPHKLIDGGLVGVSMIFAKIFGHHTLPYFLIAFNLPFVIFAFKNLGRTFVFNMFLAVVLLAVFTFFMEHLPAFEGDVLEVIVFGGLTLGIGAGLVIRMGGALDGTEIVAIIINRRKGFTVGQVVFFFNIFVFATAGIVEGDWHPALRSFMTYVIAYKIIDTVIVGLDETKSVMIISSMPRQIGDLLMHKLGLGVTFMYGRGGYTGDEREIVYVIVERLQLATLKELVQQEDPDAFLAVENLHEVISGKGGSHATRKIPRSRRPKPL
jgi:uncharacterized membrane-anchored protein YitT (DUF2179 family)